ncbi:MAG: biopolymer transporter ExbD [bacterium]
MPIKKIGSICDGKNEANITPLADVTTILIVVFLITMPALMWNGIQVNQAQAGSQQQVISPTRQTDDKLVSVRISAAEIWLNGELIPRNELPGQLQERLGERQDRTVVVIPDDEVSLGRVVDVLDVAKSSGASQLALLNEIGVSP